MRAVVQRVHSGSVVVDNKTIGEISSGVVVFIGFSPTDSIKELQWMAEKIVHLRIFEDENGKMNNSLTEIGGEMLIVSQFTLYGDCRKGRRPGYSSAAPPDIAEPLYNEFVVQIKKINIPVATGIFQANMQVSLTNDGPVTMLLDSDKKF